MPDEEVKIILELSDDAQTLLEEQDVDIYQEIQREVPSIQLVKQADPAAAPGSKDLATVILATASLASALTPIIIRILNQFTPAHRSQSWIIEETETHQADGSKIIQRKRILSNEELRSVELTTQPQPPAPKVTKDTQEP
jgi:hypothetical protein